MRYRDLTEQVFAEIHSPYTVEKRVIYKNPSVSEFRNLLQNLKPDHDPETEQAIAGTMRALLVPETQDILIWDGFFAHHGYAKDRFHLDDALHLILTHDTVRVLTLWRYERKGLDEASVRQMVEENDCLKRIYRSAFKLIIET